jgi:hypothetical protein
MPLPQRHSTTLVALAMLALSSGCGDSPTGPRPLGYGVLAVGSVQDGTIASVADTAHFSLVLTGNQGAMVYLMAKGDWLRLDVRDSTGKLVATTSDMFNTRNPERRAAGIIPASPSPYRIAVSMVQGTAPSDYEIRVVAASNAPEHVAPALAVGTVVSGEDLDHAYDVDSFTVSVDHDELVNLYLKKAIHSAPSITARLSAGDVYYAIGTTAEEADTVLGAIGSGRFTLSAGVRYTIRVGYDVTYDPPDTGSTPYEMLLQKVDPAPESVPAVIVPGDTIHESIDYLGDADEFTLNGAPGAKYNLFADAGGNPPHRITAQLIAGGANGPSVTASAGGAPLAENATGVFSLPASGTMTVRVTDDIGHDAGHLGPYRLFVYPVDSGAESATPDLALDRTTDGALDVLGDIDVYRLTVASDTEVNIVVGRPESSSIVPLAFTLRDAGAAFVASRTLGSIPTPGDTAALGTTLLHAGSYTLTVSTSSSTAGGYIGPYEILPRSINRAPETIPRSIAVGDTVRGQSLDVAGDIDQFTVTLTVGDSVYVYLKPATPEVHLGGGMRRVSDGTYFGLDAFNFAAGTPAVQSRIFVAPTTGAYVVEVSGETAGVDQAETGGYTVALPRISATPEDRAPAFALGDTVTSSIDVAGDVDDFTLVAAPGTELTGGIRNLDSCPVCAQISLIDAETGAMLLQSTHGLEGFGRGTAPVGGALRVRISRQPGCGIPCDSAPWGYRFWVVPVNRAPETRAAAFTLGDTVSGEAIEPFGDIDEFTFAGTAGDTVNLYFQTPLGTWGYEGLTIALIDRTTGVTLGTLSSNNPSENLEDIALSRVVLPSSGSYMVRVAGTLDTRNKGAYRFRVARPGQ